MILEALKILIFFLIIFFLLKILSKKYTQKHTIKKFNKLWNALVEDEKNKIPTEKFVSFLNDNININQDVFLKEKIKNFLELYSNGFKNGISILEIFRCWLTRIRYDILFIPNENQPANEYEKMYKSENDNIFKKIEYQYSLNIQNGVNDEVLKNKVFFLRLNNTIELFLNKYTKESTSPLFFYWFDFFNYFLKNISKIDSWTWHMIESSLNKKN